MVLEYLLKHFKRALKIKKNIKLIISYDGTAYHGWQDNQSAPSIEGHLCLSLEKILQEKVSLQAASRTDKGVHAKHQVVNFIIQNFFLINSSFLRSLNALLPDDLVVLDGMEVRENFHPTLDSKGKIYRYTLDLQKIKRPHHRHYAWHFPYSLNLKLIKKAAVKLIGTHDFKAFCNQSVNENYKHTIRTLERIELIEHANGSLDFLIEGEDFLYKMVRNIVGSLVYIGCGKLKTKNITQILQSLDRKQAGITAPAHGLCLEYIKY